MSCGRYFGGTPPSDTRQGFFTELLVRFDSA